MDQFYKFHKEDKQYTMHFSSCLQGSNIGLEMTETAFDDDDGWEPFVMVNEFIVSMKYINNWSKVPPLIHPVKSTISVKQNLNAGHDSQWP